MKIIIALFLLTGALSAQTLDSTLFLIADSNNLSFVKRIYYIKDGDTAKFELPKKEPISSDESHMTRRQMATLVHFNKLYDSLYTKKVFHGADSLKVGKRLHSLESEIKGWK